MDAIADARARTEKIVRFLRGERRELVDGILELAEVDRLRRWEDLGYATFWSYCECELRLSSTQVFYRTSVVSILQKAPIAAEYLRDGRLCLTTLHELVDVVRPENAKQIFDEASGKSRAKVAEIAVRYHPKPDAEKPSGEIRKVPVRGAAEPALDIGAPATPAAPSPATPAAPGTLIAPAASLAAPVATVAAGSRVEPLAEDRYSVTLRFGRTFKEKLDRARTILGHAVPDGDLAKVVERGLDLLLDEEAKRRAAPRKVVTEAKGKGPRPYIPVDLTRAVWQRDQGMCTWTLASGKRCGSTRKIEIDHVVPVALGGKTELGNLRQLCSAHNQLHARQVFGRRFIEGKIAARREPDATPTDRY